MQGTVKPSDEARRLKEQGTLQVLSALTAAAVCAGFGLFADIGKTAKFWCFVAAIVTYVVVYKASDGKSAKDQIRAKALSDRSEWEKINATWKDRAGSNLFNDKKIELNQLKAQWLDIPVKRNHKLAELKTQQLRLQLERFLDQFKIESSDIPGIGPGRKSTLGSFSIETAADLSDRSLMTVPGLGPKLRGNLMSWRHSIVQKFQYDPTKGIDWQDQARVEGEILTERLGIEAKMRKARLELRHIHSLIMQARTDLHDEVERSYKVYIQSRADSDAVGS